MQELTGFPRLKLGCFPTPFYKMDNLSRRVNHPLFIKRDDLTGVGGGGNKVRKLEFVLADALAKGCDTIITTGGAQSNHAMITAACCRKINLEPILVLKERGIIEEKGNLLLNKILGAEVRFVDTDHYSEVYSVIDRLAEDLKAKGRKPYVIPLGASMPLGCLGYALGTMEMLSQAEAGGVPIDHIVCASGSGGTQAGIILGIKLLRKNVKVTGIMVSPEEDFTRTIFDLAIDGVKLLGKEISLGEEEVVLKEYIGPGYSLPSREGTEAIKLIARTEGILLDPVYAGKAVGGMLSLLEKGYFGSGENVVFIHTGGIPSIFAIPAEY